MRRRTAPCLLLAAGVVTALLSACSTATPSPPASTGPSAPVSASRSSTPAPSSSAPPAPRDPDFVTIGTAVVSGPHDSVTTTYEVGHAGTSADLHPPLSLLTDCGWTTPAVVASTLFVHGRMTITYQGGVDQDVALDSNDVFLVADPQTPPRVGHATLDGTDSFASTTNNGWSICDRRESDDPRWERAMAPGETITREVWFGLPAAVDGPSVDATVSDALAIAFAPEAADMTRQPTTKLALSGRGAATCGTGDAATYALLLSATPPRQYGDVSCQPFTP